MTALATLTYRVKCTCHVEGTGEADSYRAAWEAMDAWRQAHIAEAHRNRGKTQASYSFREDVYISEGDRTRFDGITYFADRVLSPHTAGYSQ